MFFPEFLTALVIGLILAVLFALIFDRPGPWGGFLWFFLVVFLGAWAIGAWVTPAGPVLWGVAWLPFFIGALAIALLLAAVSEPRRRRPVTTAEAAETETEAEMALGVFFWVLIIVLVLAIVAGTL